MDTIKAFVQGLAFFQWLAIIAFVFGCISVTNAVLTLKSRYLDWQATKSKKRFARRLGEFGEQLQA